MFIRDHVEDFIIDAGNDKGCKRWTRGANSEGRPHFRTEENKLILVTRYLLSKKLGRLLDRRELACHTCDHPWCCNEEHLWLGSDQENMTDKVSKGRQHRPQGEKHGLAKLTEQEVIAIRSDPRIQKEIGKTYGVSQRLVSLIKRREAWTHVK